MISKRLLVGMGLVLAMAFTHAAGAETIVVVSDTCDRVWGPVTRYRPPGHKAWGKPKNAVETWHHPGWPMKDDPDGAVWISTTYRNGQDGARVSADSWRLFQDGFLIPKGARSITGVMRITADDAEEVYLNGKLVGRDGKIRGAFVDNYTWGTILTYAVQPTDGMNRLDIIVRNYAGSASPSNNPTGLVYKLVVTYDQPMASESDTAPTDIPKGIIVEDRRVSLGGGVSPRAAAQSTSPPLKREFEKGHIAKETDTNSLYVLISSLLLLLGR